MSTTGDENLTPEQLAHGVRKLQREVQDQADAFKRELEYLRAMNEALLAERNVNLPSKIKTKIPDGYDGKSRLKSLAFITQLQLYFKLQAHQFPSDDKKLMFIATLLSGQALDWFRPHLERIENPSGKAAPSQILTADDFFKQLKQVFGPQDEIDKNGQGLLDLRQTGSMSVYITEFSRLSSFLDLNEKALMLIFFNGLKSEIKSHISYFGRPTTLPDFIRVASEVDARIYESNKLRYSRPTSYRDSPTVVQSSDDPEPMDLDAVRTNPAPDARGPGRKLTKEERDHRFENNLCLYCGKAGHKVKDCYGVKAKNSDGAKNSRS